ncbi:hypothetical protein L0668_11790 [Paraglaciecola aquimarina]|uniref:Uncharacterized protein n=1 Tax=Paraglaciecola algarum TaxID=3050085 RepID=A0ABS9D750_9ALTE|nr:hypothetical protein [Paraglaciecola sp. G1-23]MCF2948792.1 hypothetical protein [Paraglaciecola sp. G1-23]
MKLNRDVILSSILKHQNSFLKILDFIDKEGGVPEIPEKLFLNLYSHYICEDDDQNVHAQLSLAVLLKNGVFIHHDKNTGTISVADVIINMLRFIDVKRARELNRHDLEDLRQRVSDFVDRLLECAYLENDDTRELYGSFYRLLSEIHSKIKENVSALDAQVKRVSQQYKEFNAGDGETSVFELYDRVTDLYSKYVLPCYEFIDPNMEMKGKRTLTQSIEQLIKHLADLPAKLHESNRLQYRFTAVSSYYKDIGLLVRKLKQYSTYLAQDRDRYIAIDNAFNALMDDVVPLRHGKQKNKYLTPNAPIFLKLSTIDGLRDLRTNHAAKFNWVEGKTTLRFKEYLNMLQREESKPKKQLIKPLPEEVRIEEERQIEIARLIAQAGLPISIPDVHKFVFELLRQNLDSFWLGDVLFGIEEVMPYAPLEHLVFSRERRRQQDEQYYLEYLNIELARGELDV